MPKFMVTISQSNYDQ